MTSPVLLGNSIISSTLSRSLYISFVISKYMLAAKNLVLLYFSSRRTLTGLDNGLNSTASILLLAIIISARHLSSWEAEFRCDFIIPVVLFWYKYDSCINTISDLPCSILFIILSVTALDCCRFLMHLIETCSLIVLCLCIVLFLEVSACAILVVCMLLGFHNYCLQTGTVPIKWWVVVIGFPFFVVSVVSHAFDVLISRSRCCAFLQFMFSRTQRASLFTLQSVCRWLYRLHLKQLLTSK